MTDELAGLQAENVRLKAEVAALTAEKAQMKIELGAMIDQANARGEAYDIADRLYQEAEAQLAAQSLRLQQVEQLVAKWRQEATDGDTEERFYKDQCADELAEKLALSAPENPQ